MDSNTAGEDIAQEDVGSEKGENNQSGSSSVESSVVHSLKSLESAVNLQDEPQQGENNLGQPGSDPEKIIKSDDEHEGRSGKSVHHFTEFGQDSSTGKGGSSGADASDDDSKPNDEEISNRGDGNESATIEENNSPGGEATDGETTEEGVLTNRTIDEISEEEWSVVNPSPGEDPEAVHWNADAGSTDSVGEVDNQSSKVVSGSEKEDSSSFHFSRNLSDKAPFNYNDRQSSLRRRSRGVSKASEDSVDSPVSMNFRISEKNRNLSQNTSMPSENSKGKSQGTSENSGVVSGPRSGHFPEVEDAISASSGEGEDDGFMRDVKWEDNAPSRKLDKNNPMFETSRPENEVHRRHGDENGGHAETPLFLYPAWFIVQAIWLQVRLIGYFLAGAFWLFSAAFSVISHPISKTVHVTETVAALSTGAVDQGLGLISAVGEGVSKAGEKISKLSTSTLWVGLNAAYIVFMLSLLIVPTIILNTVVFNSIVENPVDIVKPLDFDFTQAKAVALVPLFSAQELEKMKNLPSKTIERARVIPVGYNFEISVSLTLPESKYNRDLGMFMVSAELLSAQDKVMFRKSKACRLRFSSTPVQLLKSLLLSVPVLIGLYTETQKLEFSILEAREQITPTVCVKILLESKANHQGGGGLPELYGAEVHVRSALPWPKSIIARFRWTFFIWNAFCVFVFLMSSVLCCCRQVLILPFGGQKDPGGDIVQGEVKHERPSELSSSLKSRRPVPGAAGAHQARGTKANVKKDHGDVTKRAHKPDLDSAS